MNELIKITFYNTQKENRTKEKVIEFCHKLERICNFKIFEFNYETNECIIHKTLCTMCSSYNDADIDDDIYTHKTNVCKFLLKLERQLKHHFNKLKIVQYADF